MTTDELSPSGVTAPLALSPEQVVVIRQSAHRLSDEFDGMFSMETIERYIADSQTRIGATAKFAQWMPVLVERFTRDRLRAVRRLEVGSSRPAVLFVCVHNAGRSQMAAGWLRHLAGDRVEVFSGGSDPGFEANRTAIAAMAEIGVDISAELPKPWTDEIVRAVDVIVTMGCGEACPVLPGKRYEDWDVADPSGRAIEEVRTIRDEIGARVEAMVHTLELVDA